MYYIDDYRLRAVKKIVPYLIEFPQIVKRVDQISSLDERIGNYWK